MRKLCALLLFSLAAPAFASDVQVAIKATDPSEPGTVLVYLQGKTKLALSPPVEPILLSQKGARFTPRVMAVVVGTQVDMTNDDFMLHDVYSDSIPKAFDTGHYPNGTRRIVTFDAPGRVEIHCRIHASMNGVILVLDSPFFGTPDNAGRLVLQHVPAGAYEVHAVRVDGADRVVRITVRADAPAVVEL